MLDVDGIPETTIQAVEAVRTARLAEIEWLAAAPKGGRFYGGAKGKKCHLRRLRDGRRFTFPSVTEACGFVGVAQPNVNAALRAGGNVYHGFAWVIAGRREVEQ